MLSKDWIKDFLKNKKVSRLLQERKQEFGEGAKKRKKEDQKLIGQITSFIKKKSVKQKFSIQAKLGIKPTESSAHNLHRNPTTKKNGSSFFLAQQSITKHEKVKSNTGEIP